MTPSNESWPFLGVCCRPELFEALKDGTITSSELSLLLVIEAHTKVGVGCYASDAYLAKYIHTSEVRAKQMITHLKKEGLLKSRVIKRRRVLWLLTR